MKALNVLIFSLVVALAAVLLLVNSLDMMSGLADHSIAFVIAIGVLGLVGAREKTPTPQA